MTSRKWRLFNNLFAGFMIAATVAAPIPAVAQTQIAAPSNKYSVNDDVQLGLKASNQVRQQMPILNDRETQEYLESVGRRLVAAIPEQYQHREFRFSFEVVNAKDLNAFALPGGPTFVNRGMIQAVRNEGELAGVMAHELSHVALRHATAQATETQKYQVGSVLGQIAGAVIGGPLGSVVGTGSQVGFGVTSLKYSRKYETQADILGAQIMARAGYDPHDLANVFKLLESQGGRSGPQFLSDHPNPGNRFERINQEAAMLKVIPNRQLQDNSELRQVQARLGRGPRALSSAEIARNGNRSGTSRDRTETSDRIPVNERVAYPSTRLRTYTGGNLYRVSIPDNWQESGGGDSITYAPAGATGNFRGQSIFTHGVMLGVTNTQGGSLRNATDNFVNGLLDTNDYLRRVAGYQRATIGGYTGLTTQLSGRSNVTGKVEIVNVYSAQLRDGNLFYLISVAPQDEISTYQGSFQSIVRSIQLTE